MARYRPGMSYQATASLGTMRYFTINTVRVKPGYEEAFAERWRAIVAAHKEAKLDEHWAVYSVSAGAPQRHVPLHLRAQVAVQNSTRPAALHTSDAYRDATGEDGRAKNLEMTRESVEADTTNHFAFSPKMSYVPKAWVDADPTFWTPPAPAPVAKKPGDKK